MQLCGNLIMNKQSKCQFAKNEFHNSWRDTAPCSLLYLVQCVVAMVTLVLLEHQCDHPLLHHCTSSIVANTEGLDQLAVWECRPDPITPICGFVNVSYSMQRVCDIRHTALGATYVAVTS